MYIKSFAHSNVPLLTRGWAASPDFLIIIFKYIIEYQAQVIVELGSGVSTSYIGHFLKKRNSGAKLYSLEHSEKYYKKTVENIIKDDLETVVNVHYCPLTNMKINDKIWNWYNIEMVDLPKIDLLIVDGPLGKVSERVRYPAIPQLFNYLKKGAVVILDDYYRKDAKENVTDWLQEYPSLILLEELESEKKTAVLIKI